MLLKFRIFIAFSAFGLATILTSCGSSSNNTSNEINTDSTAVTKTQRKCKVFNEVKQTQTILSKVGIGKLRQWKNDSFGWISSTTYYSFGSSSSINGMQNNLAYYLESENERYIETVKLMLNINNSSENSQALSLFGKITKKTFLSLKLKVPNGLLTSIKNGEDFTSDDSEFSVSLVCNRGKVDTWKLTIKAK